MANHDYPRLSQGTWRWCVDDVEGPPKITCPGTRFGMCGGVVWGREAAWSIPNIFMSHFFRLYFHDSRTQNTFQFYYKRTIKSANDYTFSTWLMGRETEHTYFASDFLLPFCSSYSLLITYATSECQSIAVYLFLKSTFEDVGFAYVWIERLHLHKSPHCSQQDNAKLGDSWRKGRARRWRETQGENLFRNG